MKLSSLSCVICLAAIAVGEESQHQHPHLNINQSTTEPLITKHDDHDHDHNKKYHHRNLFVVSEESKLLHVLLKQKDWPHLFGKVFRPAALAVVVADGVVVLVV